MIPWHLKSGHRRTDEPSQESECHEQDIVRIRELEQQLADADLLIEHEEKRSQAFLFNRAPPDETADVLDARARRRDRQECPSCQGTGSIVIPEDISQEYSRRECPRCHGTGKLRGLA